MNTQIPRRTVFARRGMLVCGGALLLAGAALSGCQTSYAADIRNTTPQVVYAQLMRQFDNGAIPQASVRLGPGDRGGLGPIIAGEGKAFLVVDTVANPGTAVTVPMFPGTTTIEVIQTGDQTTGPVQVRIIGGNPPVQQHLPPPPRPGGSEN